MLFATIPALPEVKDLLLRSARSGQVAHAQLFAGVEGGAALALALAYATYLSCDAPLDTDACGQCPACSKMARLVHPDLHWLLPLAESKLDEDERNARLGQWRAFLLDQPFPTYHEWMQELKADNKQGTISREAAAQLPMRAAMAAFEAPYKFFIIWLPELLHPAAANALLKLLEEPPRRTVFLLVSNNPGALLPTIISRTQRVSVRAHTDDELTEFLHHQHHLPPDAARATAQLAEGSLYAALALRGEVGTELFDFLVEWLRDCYGMKWQKLLDDTGERFQKMGREGQKHLLRYGLGLVRKVLLTGVDPALVPALPPNEAATVPKMARLITPHNADAIVKAFTDAHYHVERNANPKLVFFDTSLTLWPLLRVGG